MENNQTYLNPQENPYNHLFVNAKNVYLKKCGTKENAYVALLNQSTRKPNKQYKIFKAGLQRLINKEKGR